MNSLYKIESLLVKNFKLFGDEFNINFNANDLVVFDGPNGHGKTTVFDALELALTGGIRRLAIVENLQTPNDVVVAHKNRSDCFVQLKITNERDSLIIKRALKSIKPRNGTKISNFSLLWDLTVNEGNTERAITQEELSNFISCPELKRDFTFFHYVEQEDTAHFLKIKNEKERAKALAVLFGDTKEMQEKVFKVELLESRLKKAIGQLNIDQQKIVERIGDVGPESQVLSTKQSFSKLLNWKDQVEWDNENLSNLTFETKQAFVEELLKLRPFIEHKSHYLINRAYQSAAKQSDVLRNLIGFSLYITQANEITTLKSKFDACTGVLSMLRSNALDKLFEYKDFTHVLDLIKYTSKEELFSDIRVILDGNKNNSDSSKLISEVLSIRSTLAEHQSHHTDDTSCLFCGHSYKSKDELLSSIKNKESALKAVLSSDGQRLQVLIDEFNNNKVKVIITNLEVYISSLTIPSDLHLAQLKIALEYKSRFEGLNNWLKSIDVEYKDLLLGFEPSSFNLEEIQSNTEKLQERIVNKIPDEPDGYSDFSRELNFDHLFRYYFDSNKGYLNGMTISNIDLKASYINEKYIESLSIDRQHYKENAPKLTKLNNKLTDVSALKIKLKKTISRYQKRLIKDVEIPFYIYSGKVLQSHQSNVGTGIFIKDKTGEDELKNIRFVANWDSDHDVLNTMSSGQIAAIVISLYLALNKVYSQGLGTILIDDPVQTMDEINMISLVELLRNEFADRQLILSTHEDHVSKYFLYKFLKYGRSARQIRLIDRKEYQLSNKAKEAG
jgi:exonuclease SbcC